MNQPSLFDPAPPAQRHSASSVAAAGRARPAAPAQRQQVLDYLRDHGPATDEQIQQALGMNPSSQRPRRVELVRAGAVIPAEAAGRTSSGRLAARWKAAP
jgi:hypothetical protein